MTYRFFPSLLCALPLLLASLPLLSKTANAEANKPETLTVTGTHIPDSSETGRLPKFTITADEISALAANSFADVLAGVPGIDIFEQGGVGGLTFLSVRGGDPNFVVILIDGVKVNDATNSRGGAFDLGTIDPAVIEKVEVYYGSFSTVYGSDALAGVVSIETKKFTEHQAGTASFKIASNDTKGATVVFGLGLADVAQLSVITSFQDGDDSTFGDAFKRQEVIASLTSVADGNTSWDMAFFYAEGEAETFPEDSGGDRLAVIRDPESRDYSQTTFTAGVQQRLSKMLNVNVKAAWSQRKEDIANPGIAPGVLDGVPAIDSSSHYKRLDLSATASYQLSKSFIVALGGAYAKEDGGTKSIIDFGFPVPADYTLNRKTNSLFAELRLDPVEQLHITLSLRRDKAQDNDATTAHVIGRYQITPSSTISAQYSEGFKLPSFFAVAHPFVGNPNLQPEQSQNYDLSIDSAFMADKLTSRISIYKNTFTDLVDFDPIAFTNVNRSKVTAQGVEVYLAYKASEQLSVSGQITHNNVDVDEAGIELRRRPKLKASLLLNYQASDQLSFTGRVISNDDYFDSSIATGTIEMPGYSHLDVSASWSLNETLILRAHVKNVLDNDKEQAVGFDNTGRSLTLSISKGF